MGGDQDRPVRHEEDVRPDPRLGPTGDGDLQVAFDKEMVKDAPRIDPEGHLSPEEERELWQYYGYDYAPTKTSKDYGYGKAYTAQRADRDYTWRDEGSDQAMTRSEEELRVSKERQPTGKVRLRKYVVTEHQQMTVPVQREEVRVEREPITEANRGAAMRGPDISEGEHEVTTYEERPVVGKETVPKERVRLEKETVTDTETVGGEVRKEKVDVEGDVEQADPAVTVRRLIVAGMTVSSWAQAPSTPRKRRPHRRATVAVTVETEDVAVDDADENSDKTGLLGPARTARPGRAGRAATPQTNL